MLAATAVKVIPLIGLVLGVLVGGLCFLPTYKKNGWEEVKKKWVFTVLALIILGVIGGALGTAILQAYCDIRIEQSILNTILVQQGQHWKYPPAQAYWKSEIEDWEVISYSADAYPINFSLKSPEQARARSIRIEVIVRRPAKPEAANAEWQDEKRGQYMSEIVTDAIAAVAKAHKTEIKRLDDSSDASQQRLFRSLIYPAVKKALPSWAECRPEEVNFRYY